MKHLAMVVLYFPLLAFCLAGVAEAGSQKAVAQKARALTPIALGLGAFGLLFAPSQLALLTSLPSLTLSRLMTMACATVASSAAFVSYSKRASGVWVACGGLLLAFFWMFNGIIT